MRIAQICQSYPPMISGASRVVEQLSQGMAERGHSVLVLAASEMAKSYVRVHGRLRVCRLGGPVNPFRRGQRFVLWPRATVMAEFKAFQPEIVHAHDPLGIGLIAILNAHALDVPVVFTAHQLPWFVRPLVPTLPGLRAAVDRMLWAYARWLGRRCHCLVAPTRPVAEMLRNHNMGLVEVISHGVDGRLFSPSPCTPDESVRLRRKFGLEPQLPVILFVGRVDADKQVELVVDAAARVLRTIDAQLLVVGDGARLLSVIHLAQKLGIRHRSHFPGFVPAHGDLPGLYRLASVFITVSTLETQCLTILEASLAGVPVVSVRTEVMLELVQDGVNGFLAPPNDVDGMADRLGFLLRHPLVASEMGATARRIAQEFSLVRMLDSYERLYGEVACPPPCSRS